MKPEEFAINLQKKFPKFGKKIINDITAKGEEFCEIIYPNDSLPSLPITVTVFENGAMLSFGNMQNVTGEGKITFEQTCQAINDIINNKIIFVFSYDDLEKRDSGRLSDGRIFFLSDGEDDMRREYEKFVEMLKKPLGKLGRMFTPYKGIFVFTSFSGSVNFEIMR